MGSTPWWWTQESWYDASKGHHWNSDRAAEHLQAQNTTQKGATNAADSHGPSTTPIWAPAGGSSGPGAGVPGAAPTTDAIAERDPRGLLPWLVVGAVALFMLWGRRKGGRRR